MHGDLGSVHEDGGVVVRPLRAACRDRYQALVLVEVERHVDRLFAPPEKAGPLRGCESRDTSKRACVGTDSREHSGARGR